MKYTREQRLDIGRRIYNGEITKSQAAEIYKIGRPTARDYLKLYRSENNLPPMNQRKSSDAFYVVGNKQPEPKDLKSYEAMSKEELIKELLKARIAEARLKKGYEVKGDGSIIRYGSKNTR